MGDLNELLAGLGGHREAIGLEANPDARTAFRSVMPGLPLLHRLGTPLEDPMEALNTRRVRLRPGPPKHGRQALGTDGCVFTSMGVAAFTDSSVVVAFGPVISMRPGRLTLPWDSRGIGSVLHWSTEYHAAQIDRFTLPATDDETYLADHLSTYFGEPQRFIAAERPIAVDETGLFAWVLAEPPNADRAGFYTPESRFPGEVLVGAGELMAVVYDPDAHDGSPEWRQTINALTKIAQLHRRPVVRVRRQVSGVDFTRAVSDVVKNMLEDGGYLP